MCIISGAVGAEPVRLHNWLPYDSDDAGLIKDCLKKAPTLTATPISATEIPLDLPMLHPIGWIHIKGDSFIIDKQTKEALKAHLYSWLPVLKNSNLLVASWVKGSYSSSFAHSVSTAASQAAARTLVDISIPPDRIKLMFFGDHVRIRSDRRSSATPEVVIAFALQDPRKDAGEAGWRWDSQTSLIRSLYYSFSFEASRLGIPLIDISGSSPKILNQYFNKEITHGLLRDQRCSARRGVPCEVNFGILWANSQDPDFCNATIRKDNDDAIVNLYDRFDSDQTVRFKFDRKSKSVKIADVISSEGSSLRNLLR